MVIKGKIRILKWEDKQKSLMFVSQRVRQPVGEKRSRRGRGGRRRKKKEKEKKNKCMFFFFFFVFGI